MNDYAWNNASAIERCEILKARLDRIEAGPPLRPLRDDDPVMFCGATREDIAWLRRIEQAAKVAHVWLLVGGAAEANAACEKLGAALDSEPGR